MTLTDEQKSFFFRTYFKYRNNKKDVKKILASEFNISDTEVTVLLLELSKNQSVINLNSICEKAQHLTQNLKDENVISEIGKHFSWMTLTDDLIQEEFLKFNRSKPYQLFNSLNSLLKDYERESMNFLSNSTDLYSINLNTKCIDIKTFVNRLFEHEIYNKKMLKEKISNRKWFLVSQFQGLGKIKSDKIIAQL